MLIGGRCRSSSYLLKKATRKPPALFQLFPYLQPLIMKANVSFSYSQQCVKPTDPVYFSATRSSGKEHCDNFILTAFKCNLNAWSYCKPWEIPDIACQQKVGDARSFCCCLFSLLFQFWELIQKIAYLFSLNLFFSLSLPLYFLIFIYFSSPLTFLSLYRLFF